MDPAAQTSYREHRPHPTQGDTVTDHTTPAACDTPPLVAELARPVYRWQNPEPDLGLRAITLHVSEALTVSDDRREITASQVASATMQVTLWNDEDHAQGVPIPLTPEIADAMTDALEAYRALHHLHVELAARRRPAGAVSFHEDEMPAVLAATRSAARRSGAGNLTGADREAFLRAETALPGCVCKYECNPHGEYPPCGLDGAILHLHGRRSCPVHPGAPEHAGKADLRPGG